MLLTIYHIYLNSRVFLSRNYQLIVAPRKFDVLKTNICTRNEALRANMLVLRTSNFLGATIRPIVPRHKHSIVIIVLHYFFPRASSFIILNYFQLFRWKPLKWNVKFEKQNRQKSTWYNFNSLFSISLLVCRKIFTDEYITVSIRVFSTDGQYGLIVSLRGWTLSRHVINLNQWESEKIWWWSIIVSSVANQRIAFVIDRL